MEFFDMVRCGAKAGRVIGRGGAVLRELHRHLGATATVKVVGEGAAAEAHIRGTTAGHVAAARVEVEKRLAGKRYGLALHVTPLCLVVTDTGTGKATTPGQGDHACSSQVMVLRRFEADASQPLSNIRLRNPHPNLCNLPPTGIVGAHEWYDAATGCNCLDVAVLFLVVCGTRDKAVQHPLAREAGPKRIREAGLDLVASLVTDVDVELTGHPLLSLITAIQRTVLASNATTIHHHQPQQQQDLLVLAADVLGVAPGASAGELKKAYRKRAFGQFPDRMSAQETAELNQARVAYERLLAAASPGGPDRKLAERATAVVNATPSSEAATAHDITHASTSKGTERDGKGTIRVLPIDDGRVTHPQLCIGFPEDGRRAARQFSPDLVTFVICTRGEGGQEEVLLVQEGKRHNNAWFLPAGHVDIGETFSACGVRECLEETGARIECTGCPLTEFIHGSRARYEAAHVVVHARCIGGALKSHDDGDTVGAQWFLLVSVLDMLSHAPQLTSKGASPPLKFRKPHEVGHILRRFASLQRLKTHKLAGGRLFIKYGPVPFA